LDTNELIDSNGTAESTRAKNYTISAWVYLPAVCQFPSRILSLCRASDKSTKEKGSPAVMYDSNGKMRVIFSNLDGATQKTIEIPPQRWNHLVFVYDNQVAHFYLNSKLMFSEPLSEQLPIYSFADELVTGDEMMIDGKISGATYVPTTYTAQQVVGIYNTTRRFYM